MSDKKQKEYKGFNGSMILTDSGVIIKRGLKGALMGGGALRGDKTIPYTSIVAVQLKKAGLTSGYLQLTLSGGSEAKGGIFEAVKDENTISFYNWSNKDFEQAKSEVESQLGRRMNKNAGSIDELEKLAALRDKGIVSEKEFNLKKKQLLGL